MAKEKQYWQIMVDKTLEKDYDNWAFWYENQYKKKPSKTQFIKTSLEIFKEVEPKIKRKNRSRKIKCL